MISLPLGWASCEARYRVHFVNQHVTAVAVLWDRRARTTVTGNNYRSVCSLKTKPVGLFPRTVVDQEGFDGNVLVFVDNARFDLVIGDSVAGLVRRLPAAQPDVDILAVS